MYQCDRAQWHARLLRPFDLPGNAPSCGPAIRQAQARTKTGQSLTPVRDFRPEEDVAIMTVRDLTRQDMDVVINNLNNNFNANVSVLNWGQLGFALDKPRMSLRGMALYPEMHQKAAVLMETLCRSHTLTDGNKRASVMAAEYLANINGTTLVVPLKTARMAVDCATDADDRMSAEIAAWFKAHSPRRDGACRYARGAGRIGLADRSA